jgi:hypothetical protein
MGHMNVFINLEKMDEIHNFLSAQQGIGSDNP